MIEGMGGVKQSAAMAALVPSSTLEPASLILQVMVSEPSGRSAHSYICVKTKETHFQISFRQEEGERMAWYTLSVHALHLHSHVNKFQMKKNVCFSNSGPMSQHRFYKKGFPCMHRQSDGL